MTISDEEYEIIKEALLNLMRHNSIATGHGDTILELIATINASIIDLRHERSEAIRQAKMYLDGWRAATEKGDMAVELERCGDK